ncbi:Nucleolin 2 [Grifola frondosa]|uniref:Nucleolin 2 n=1 Tax=Grifola frondosa TaxID=5627 RepID=A0A1C7MBI1_GRIFR|nr:Nucleolin 2 [Grifola frondosa]
MILATRQLTLGRYIHLHSYVGRLNDARELTSCTDPSRALASTAYTQECLRLMFEKYGDIEIRMKRTPEGEFLGYSQVKVASPTIARQVIDDHLWHPVQLEAGASLPPSRTLFVGNIPFVAEEEDIRALFEESSHIEEIRMAYNDYGEFLGFAHVDFTNVDDTHRIVDSHVATPLTLQGRTIRLGDKGRAVAHIDFDNPKDARHAVEEYARNPRTLPNGTLLQVSHAKLRQRVEHPPSHHLFITHYADSEDRLRKELGIHERNVQKINFYIRRGGTSRMAFIDFVTTEAGIAAKEAFAGKPGPLTAIGYSQPK